MIHGSFKERIFRRATKLISTITKMRDQNEHSTEMCMTVIDYDTFMTFIHTLY